MGHPEESVISTGVESSAAGDRDTLDGGASQEGRAAGLTAEANGGSSADDRQLTALLDSCSLERVVEIKISRFFDQLAGFYPENLHELMLRKMEKPLIDQILRRVGGNQVQASKILGINRNTLRKKIRIYDIQT